MINSSFILKRFEVEAEDDDELDDYDSFRCIFKIVVAGSREDAPVLLEVLLPNKIRSLSIWLA